MSRETLFAVGMLFAGVFLIYLPAIQTDFLFRDDCIYFTMPRGLTLTRITLVQARPFLGLFADALNRSVISGTGWMRVVPVLGLGMLSVFLYAWFRKFGLHWVTAGLLALSVSCVSAFQDTVCYLTVCGSIYASLFSTMAIHAFFYESEREPSRRVRFFLALLTSLLLFLGLSCYQPSAMFCWALFVVPIFLVNTEDWPRFRWRFLKFGILFGITLLGYVLIYKAILRYLGGAISPRGQTANFQQICEKLTWFWTDFILKVGHDIARPLRDFGPSQIKYAAILALALALGGLLFIPSRQTMIARFGTWCQRIAILPALAMLCYLPFIVVPEFGIDPIYTIGLQVTLFLAACLGTGNWIRFLPKWNEKKQVEIGLTAILFGLMAFSASGRLIRDYAFPNHNEYSYMRSVMFRSDLAQIKRIHVVGHLNFSIALAYPEALVQGVLNEAAPNLHPEITSSSITAPEIIHSDILDRHAAIKEYYVLDDRNGFYVLKPDLTAEQRGKVDRYFADQAEIVAKLPNVLVIDLSKANAAY